MKCRRNISNAVKLLQACKEAQHRLRQFDAGRNPVHLMDFDGESLVFVVQGKEAVSRVLPIASRLADKLMPGGEWVKGELA